MATAPACLSNPYKNALLWLTPTNLFPTPQQPLTFSFGVAGAYDLDGGKFTALRWDPSTDI